MRKIEDYFKDMPILMKEKSYIQKLEILLEKKKRGEKVEIEGYAPPNVKKKLVEIFFNTCAFCESNISEGHHYDTEHFRPKSIYYWLAFEWSNFLLSCRKCNSDCKDEQFPITEKQAKLPTEDFATNIDAFLAKCSIKELEDEGRQLLHPVLDTPYEHLDFQKNGRVNPKHNSLKGKHSINVYGLDDWEDKKGKKGKRQDLIKARKKIIQHIEGEVEHAVFWYKDGERLYEDIKKIHVELIRDINNREPHSAVRQTCIEKFKAFFIDDLPFLSRDKERLEKVYERLKKDLTS